jgi:Xaa-Pro aminopeptidase
LTQSLKNTEAHRNCDFELKNGSGFCLRGFVATHYVGLATHDAGGRDLSPSRILKPGMVFACDVFATFPGENLGVRVENTVLITEKGCEILNPGIPREIEEIEALMQSKTVVTEAISIPTQN